MTTFACSLFYAYVLYAINYYRKEISYRTSASSIGKTKTPLSVKKVVFLFIAILLINLTLETLIGTEHLVLINLIPVLLCLFKLRRYEKKIIKMDKE